MSLFTTNRVKIRVKIFEIWKNSVQHENQSMIFSWSAVLTFCQTYGQREKQRKEAGENGGKWQKIMFKNGYNERSELIGQLINKNVCFLHNFDVCVAVFVQFLVQTPILVSFSHSGLVLPFWPPYPILISFSHSGLVLPFWSLNSTIVLLLLRSFSMIGSVTGDEEKFGVEDTATTSGRSRGSQKTAEWRPGMKISYSKTLKANKKSRNKSKVFLLTQNIKIIRN